MAVNPPANEIVIPYAPRPVQREMHRALETHRFAVMVAHRRLGKTVCILNHLLKRALQCPLPRGRYAYIAPERTQAKDIAWDYLKYFTAPFGKRRTVNESDLWVMLPNQARIRLYGADNPDSLRGRYLDGAALDEVAQMKPNTWGEVVRPALSDRQGFGVFIGTPKGLNVFHELYQLALKTEGWFGGIWRVDQTKVIPEDELAAIRAELSPNQYRQEYLCDFSASSDDVLITLDLVDEASRRVILEADVRGAEKVIGVDVARFGDDATVITRRHGLYVYPQDVYHGLSCDETADRVAYLINTFEPDAVNIDAGGVGAGVVDILRRWHFAVNGIDFGAKPRQEKVYLNKRAEMWGDLRDKLRAGLALPDDPELKTDLTQPRYWYSESGSKIQLESKKSIKERGGRSPDRGDSLALTVAVPVVPRGEGLSAPVGRTAGGFGNEDGNYDPLA